MRPHFVKATVKVSRYPAGGLAIFYGRRCLGRYNPDGSPPGEVGAVPSHPAARLASRAGAVRDGEATALARREASLTAPARDAIGRGRSAPGNGPDSLTRKCQTETPLLQRTKQKRTDT